MLTFSRCIEAVWSCQRVKTSANNIWTFSTATRQSCWRRRQRRRPLVARWSRDRQAGKAPVAGIRVGDTATRADDLRNRKQHQQQQQRCRAMSDGCRRSSRPSRSLARVAAEVMPVIGVVERALNFIVSRRPAPLSVSRMLHGSVTGSC